MRDGVPPELTISQGNTGRRDRAGRRSEPGAAERLAELTMPRFVSEDAGHKKIRCGNQSGGRVCGRWVARIEDGALYISCKRCGGEVVLELAMLAREYRDWLVQVAQELRAAGQSLEGEDHAEGQG